MVERLDFQPNGSALGQTIHDPLSTFSAVRYETLFFDGYIFQE